jgi:hypothetical protein
MISRLFRERIPLVADPGSGDVVLRLSLPEDQVLALRAVAGGGKASVAIRRLLATFSRRMPPSMPVHGLPRACELSDKPAALPTRFSEPERTGLIRLLEIPSWFDPENPNRLSYWKSLGYDNQLQIIEAHPVSVPEPEEAPANAGISPPSTGATLISLIASVLLFALMVFLADRQRARAASAPSPGPSYPPWRPE